MTHDTPRPPPLDPAPLGFRPLTPDDLPLMHRWLNAPHVHEWWSEGDPPPTSEKVAAEYGAANTEPVDRYIILHGETPIGYIQSYRVGAFAVGEHAYPEFIAQIGEPDAAGIDVFIGEEVYLHRGLGPHLLRAFLRDIIFADPRFHACIIDPYVPNAAAIRAYTKAGFRYVRTITIASDPYPCHLMRITRDDLA